MSEPKTISAERARKNMSQDELAAYLGVSRRTVQNYENGGDIPSSKVKKMSLFFGVSADYLLGLSDQHKYFNPHALKIKSVI